MAATASTADHRVHNTPCHQGAPCDICRSGKRLRATSRTKAGAIKNETAASATTTTAGVNNSNKMTCGNTALSRGKPTASSQPHNTVRVTDDSSEVPSASIASAQNKYPSTKAKPPLTSTGNSDKSMTRGCKQYHAARQKASRTARTACVGLKLSASGFIEAVCAGKP